MSFTERSPHRYTDYDPALVQAYQGAAPQGWIVTPLPEDKGVAALFPIVPELESYHIEIASGVLPLIQEEELASSALVALMSLDNQEGEVSPYLVVSMMWPIRTELAPALNRASEYILDMSVELLT